MKNLIPCCMFATLLLGGVTQAPAEDVIKASYESHAIEPKVDTWVRGTLTGVSAPKGTFTVRGARDHRAIALAKMLRELEYETQDLLPVTRRAKEQEIRQKWAPVLQAARERVPDNETLFTFHLPQKGEMMNVYDESLRRESEIFTADGIIVSRTEQNDRTISGLNLGDFIAVGYESGTISGIAYVVIKTEPRKKLIVIGDPEPVIEMPGGVLTDNPDSQIHAATLTKIQESLRNNSALSASAKNVQLLRGKHTLTLRGLVNSFDEKVFVEKTAAVYVGYPSLISRLEVKQ